MKTLFSFGHAVAANDVPLNNVGLPLSWFLNDFWFVRDNLGKIFRQQSQFTEKLCQTCKFYQRKYRFLCVGF